MPQQIDVPGLGVVEFPDGMTDEQIVQAIRANTPKTGMKEVAQEAGRVLDKTVRGGATALPAMMGEAGMAVPRNIEEKSMDPLMGTPGGAILRALSMFGGNPAKDTKFGDVTNTIQTAGGLLPPISTPQTDLGKAAGNIGEATVGTVLGGGAGTIGQKAAVGVGGGAGGELSARLFGDNALTRLLGALTGGGAVSVGQAMRPNADKLIKQATEHVTDADFSRAGQIEQLLNAQKIPHTKSQLLGPRSTLDDVVATASANPSVRPSLTELNTAGPLRPGGPPAQASHALNVWTNQNLPPPAGSNRSAVLSDVQETAEGALKTLRDRSNRAFEKVMPPKHIEYDQGRVRTLYNSLRQLADDPRFGKTGPEGKAILKVADMLVDSRQWDLSRVHPVLLAKAQNAAKAKGVPLDPSTVPGAREVTKFVTNAHKINNINKDLKLLTAEDDFKGLPIKDVRRILNQATPEFDRARGAKESIMRKQYDPAAKGLTGQLAQIGGGVKQDKLTVNDRAMAIVFNPSQPQAAEIRELAKTLGGDQVGELLREHIHKSMQVVLKSNDKSPRSFVAALYESPAQRENIDAALEVVARHNRMNPDAVKHGFKRLMEALDTFEDLKLAQGVSPATTATQAGQNVVSQVATPLTGTRRFFEQRVTKQAYQQIADLVTSPGGLKKIQAIARAPDQAALRQVIISTLISAQQGPKGE
jgi:hypothetical protein